MVEQVKFGLDGRRVLQAKQLAGALGLKTSTYIERLISREFRDTFPDQLPPGLDVQYYPEFVDPTGPLLQIWFKQLPATKSITVNVETARALANALEKHAAEAGHPIEIVSVDREDHIQVGRRGNGVLVVIKDNDDSRPPAFATMTPSLADDYAKSIHDVIDRIIREQVDDDRMSGHPIDDDNEIIETH